ncbi:MAG: NAD(P)H-dependent oxidoreductase [Magnetococcus sp. DMHC-6]
MKPKILALSASLRNGRWADGVQNLLDEIRQLSDKNELLHFIEKQGQIHVEHFLDAGRKEGLPFDEIYKKLRKLAGNKGLCNSEIGMVVALWAAYQKDCEIDYLPLSHYFTPDGKQRNLDELGQRVQAADALLFCSPVYFGDRSSLAADFIEFIRSHAQLRQSLSGKPVGGIAVGAKRNGGQETTLIYQLLDMLALGMLGLGNDSESTSQYGGTIHAGDVGTAAKDEYGLNTAMGMGRRLAQVLKLSFNADPSRLKKPVRVLFLRLQDQHDYAKQKIQQLVQDAGEAIEATILETIDGDISRCIACDICPIRVGPDAEYRCIITRKSDQFVQFHEQLMDYDLIVPVVYSPISRVGLVSNYQHFIERGRYLRRGDYLWSNIPIMPLILEEIGAQENLHIRILTSFIRHHTIMLRANIGYIHNNVLLNAEELLEYWRFVLDQTKRLTVGRLDQEVSERGDQHYRPVGYIMSAAKDKELSVQERREVLNRDREQRHRLDAQHRLCPKDGDRSTL